MVLYGIKHPFTDKWILYNTTRKGCIIRNFFNYLWTNIQLQYQADLERVIQLRENDGITEPYPDHLKHYIAETIKVFPDNQVFEVEVT